MSAFAAASSPHTLQTFAVGFEDRTWDESALAADTARRIKSDHHVVIAEPREFLGLLPRLIWHHDEPLSHPNSIPLYQLSRFAREFVTVILTGEGADELFCGYPRYHVARWRGAADPLPPVVRGLLASLAAAGSGHRLAKVADSLRDSLDDAILFNSAYVEPELVGRLSRGPVDAALDERRALLARARSKRRSRRDVVALRIADLRRVRARPHRPHVDGGESRRDAFRSSTSRWSSGGFASPGV